MKKQLIKEVFDAAEAHLQANTEETAKEFFNKALKLEDHMSIEEMTDVVKDAFGKFKGLSVEAVVKLMDYEEWPTLAKKIKPVVMKHLDDKTWFGN